MVKSFSTVSKNCGNSAWWLGMCGKTCLRASPNFLVRPVRDLSPATAAVRSSPVVPDSSSKPGILACYSIFLSSISSSILRVSRSASALGVSASTLQDSASAFRVSSSASALRASLSASALRASLSFSALRASLSAFAYGLRPLAPFCGAPKFIFSASYSSDLGAASSGDRKSSSPSSGKGFCRASSPPCFSTSIWAVAAFSSPWSIWTTSSPSTPPRTS